MLTPPHVSSLRDWTNAWKGDGDTHRRRPQEGRPPPCARIVWTSAAIACGVASTRPARPWPSASPGLPLYGCEMPRTLHRAAAFVNLSSAACRSGVSSAPWPTHATRSTHLSTSGSTDGVVLGGGASRQAQAAPGGAGSLSTATTFKDVHGPLVRAKRLSEVSSAP